jgi:hypothetical protein
VFFEPLHVVICFVAQFVHPANEGALLICIIERKGIKSVLAQKVFFFFSLSLSFFFLAKEEELAGKQVARFLLFL